jgi:hypothetical protein
MGIKEKINCDENGHLRNYAGLFYIKVRLKQDNKV